MLKKSIGVLLGAMLCIPLAQAAVPQADSAATQESRFREEKLLDSPDIEEKKSPAVIEDRVEAKAAEPSGAAMKIPVKEVRFIGNYSIPESELMPLVKDLIGREATLGEIQAAVSRVKRHYREKGYVATYAYVPPQEIQDGVVSIDVIEGRLGELRVEGAKFHDNARLRRQFSIRAGDVLTYNAIRKDLNRLNRSQDIRAKLSLEAGKDIGTADALVTVEDKYPVHLSMDINNSGTKNTGLYRWGTSARNNNVTGHNDSLSLTTQASSGVKAIGGGYEVPLPVFDGQTRAGYLLSHADVDIGGDFRALQAEGKATTHSGYITRPLWETTNLFVSGTAGLDFKQVRNKLLGQSSGKDDLRVVRAETSVEHTGSADKTLLNGGLYLGIPDIFGGMDDVDVNATRPNTGSEFFIARAQGAHFRRLSPDFLLSLRGTAQGTPDSLPSSEQFRLGGATTVRGYPESDSSVDYGAHLSVELFYPIVVIPADWRVPTGEKMRDAVQGFVFADGGSGALRSPAVGEDKHKTLAGVGLGFRFHLGEHLYARTEWGFPVEDEATNGKSCTFYFTISYEFF